MDLGVDFGTTRTIVASVDRGNYPITSFFDENGDAHEYFPSVVALSGDDLVYGFEALTAAKNGASLVRSFKRALARSDVNTETTIMIGGREFRLLDVITGFFIALRTALRTHSSLHSHIDEEDHNNTVVAVPAHAHSAQRLLTLEAFRRAGFDVAAMINEPSAAGFEYSHRQGRTLTSRRTRVVVYDLGGGTFDASLLKVDGKNHEVLGSLGINNLGGDDFDTVLAECAMVAAGRSREELSQTAYDELLEWCREAKEQLYPQSRRIALEVDGVPVDVQVEDFYSAAVPLVEATVEAMSPLMAGLEDDKPDLTEIAGIYLVGGASALPLVPRVLRERFGRRVHRSPYPAASTAIGLAIAADEEAGYTLKDLLSRGFGVFREGSSGHTLQFDPIFTRDDTMSPQTNVMVTRRYRAVHNVGWFRFVEYTSVDDNGEPMGDIAPFAEIIFPFDKALETQKNLEGVPVERRNIGPLVEENYIIDPHGIVEVRITNLDTGYTQTHTLGTG